MILQRRRLHKEGREIIFVLTDVLVNSVIFWSPEARINNKNRMAILRVPSETPTTRWQRFRNFGW